MRKGGKSKKREERKMKEKKGKGRAPNNCSHLQFQFSINMPATDVRKTADDAKNATATT